MEEMAAAEVSQLPPAKIGEIVAIWVADVRALHRRLHQVLQDPGIRTGLAPRMRQKLEELLVELRDCQFRAPSAGMIRGWAKALAE
jgi:hypothetical protein